MDKGPIHGYGMQLTVFSHKVCWVCPNSPSGYATDGGFPMQMEALSELFDSTVLVIPKGKAVPTGELLPLKGKNLSVICLSVPLGKGHLRKIGTLFWLVKYWEKLWGEVLRADFIHTPIPGDIGMIAMGLSLHLKKPLLVRYCGNWFSPRSYFERLGIKIMEKKAGGKNIMLATGLSPDPPSIKNSAIQWIFSSSLKDNTLRELNHGGKTLRTDGRFRLITVARQIKSKGTDRIIEALPGILKIFPKVNLEIVGEGEHLTEFKTLVEKLKVQEHVFFYGNLTHESVLKLLQKVDLFCFPTQSEGFPKVVLEALACGLPVVTTEVFNSSKFNWDKKWNCSERTNTFKTCRGRFILPL